MNEEEKTAIETLKYISTWIPEVNILPNKQETIKFETILNLISKQQQQIEEYKKFVRIVKEEAFDEYNYHAELILRALLVMGEVELEDGVYIKKETDLDKETDFTTSYYKKDKLDLKEEIEEDSWWKKKN